MRTSGQDGIGLSFDAAGSLYFNTGPAHTGIWKIPGADPSVAPINVVPPFSGPVEGGTAFASNGDLLAVDFSGGRVVKSPAPLFGPLSNFITGLVQPQWIAVDSAGNLYLSSQTGEVTKVDPAGGLIGTLAEVWGQLEDIETDSAGNVYVNNYSEDTVLQIAPDGIVTTIAAVNEPLGLALCEP